MAKDIDYLSGDLFFVSVLLLILFLYLITKRLKYFCKSKYIAFKLLFHSYLYVTIDKYKSLVIEAYF